MAKTDIRGGQIRDGTLTNIDIAINASISGLKISPSFGAQNVDIGIGQTYRVNGVQVSSANLSNDSNIVKASLLTTEGDLYYRGVSGLIRLPLGASGYVLTVSGTGVVWAAATGGGANPATLEPGIVNLSTSGAVGVSLKYAREDHSHDLGAHGHTGATNGGTIAASSLTGINTAFNKNFGIGALDVAAGNDARLSDSRKCNNTFDIPATALVNIGGEPAFTKNTAFNDNYGSTAATVCEGNDVRLSDARTPTSHAYNSHTGIVPVADGGTGGSYLGILAVDPVTPVEGDFWYNSAAGEKQFKGYNGTAIVILG